jgi:hypothetical protein
MEISDSNLFSPLVWSGNESTIVEATTGLLYQPRMMDDYEYGAVSGILSRGNRSNQKKPDSLLLCPQQIPHDLTQA